jgi:hypothetical protein
VRRLAQGLREREPVDRQRRILLQELRNPVLADVQHLRVDEGAAFRHPVAEKVGLLIELLKRGVAGVLGGLLASIRGQPVIAFGEVSLEVEALLESRGAFSEVAFASGELLELSVDLARIGVPGTRRCVHLGQIPPVGGRFSVRRRQSGGGDAEQKVAEFHGGAPEEELRIARFYAQYSRMKRAERDMR